MSLNEGMWALPGGFVGLDESLRRAHEKVQAKIDEPVVALQLVPESFTLSDLQRVHERILGTQLDKRNSTGCKIQRM